MSARRFFVEGSHEAGERVAIGERDAHKIARVLRLRDGDELEIVDALGHTFDARVRLEPQGLHAELMTMRAAASPAGLRIDIAQGIPKGAKMDFVIEKATELGAAAVLPFYSRRSVVQDLGDAKLERWRRLAKTAAAQCDRREVPEVRAPSTFETLLERCAEYDLVLMPWERAAADPLRESLPVWLERARRVLVIVGPEGGFTADEAELGRAAGARLVSLGERLLRSETAGLAMLAILEYASAT
jgi:16S rRNA (uracil1498-N3)-methyltransferase